MVQFTSVIEQFREEPPNNACSGQVGTRRDLQAFFWLWVFLHPKPHLGYLRFVLPLLVMMYLVACGACSIEYKGTYAQQTQQFLDYIHSLVTDELTAVIDDGFHSGPATEVIKRIEELDARISEVNTPECNPKTQAVKDALRLHMLEARNYFTTVAGRAVYGEGPVQAQLSKMYEADWAFEEAFEDL